MKKKLMLLSVAALFLGSGIFTATQLINKEKVSDLTLANIEAMTFEHGEIGPWGTNWKETTFLCTKTTSTGIGITIGDIGVTLPGTQTTTTYYYTGCGAGSGSCLSSAGC